MEPSASVRHTAIACHLLSFLGYFTFVGLVVGPLVVWLVKRQDDPFIDHHGRESLNFQITIFIAFIIAGLLSVFLVGLVLLPFIGLWHLVFTIIAAVRASDGRLYQYPLTIRFLK